MKVLTLPSYYGNHVLAKNSWPTGGLLHRSVNRPLVLFVSGGWYLSCSDTRSLFTQQIIYRCLIKKSNQITLAYLASLSFIFFLIRKETRTLAFYQHNVIMGAIVMITIYHGFDNEGNSLARTLVRMCNGYTTHVIKCFHIVHHQLIYTILQSLGWQPKKVICHAWRFGNKHTSWEPVDVHTHF